MNTFEDLFHLDLDSARSAYGEAAARCLEMAAEDFAAVLNCRPPVYALPDKETPRPADGGTSFYIGQGYHLTVLMSLNGILKAGEFQAGFVYGPMIRFDPAIMQGNFPGVQSLAFYPAQVLRERLGPPA